MQKQQLIFIIVRTLIFGDPTSGWPSMICIMLLIAGIQLLCMGILGQYLGKTYLETKNRPIYITKETEDIYRQRKAETKNNADKPSAPEKKEK